MANTILELQNVTKIYSNGFVANKDVNLKIEQGEIHALAGENGAGKTTLMKVIFGMEDFQQGRYLLYGQELRIASPIEAISKGIGMVHQHFMQAPSLTVAENVVLGMEPGSSVFLDLKEAERMTQEISDRYQLKVNASDKIADLGVGLRQKVEILKALIRNCKILILDEPTAVLTPQETQELFVQLKELRKNGISIIFISHKLDEVMELCDRVTVLRAGTTVGTDTIDHLTPAIISKMMVGRDIKMTIDKEAPAPGRAILQLEKVSYFNKDNIKKVSGVSFSVHEGEILGIAGIEGNGQNEIAELISGNLEYHRGNIFVNGSSIKGKTINGIRNMGLSYISEDRMLYGCAPNLTVRENIFADRLNDRAYRRFGIFLNNRKIIHRVNELIQEYEIACDGYSQPVRMLSGGNIQKVIVAREFSRDACLIIANQPTRGIDVGTSDMIRRTLVRKTREEGIAALLISSDLNEILEVSDRLLVMKGGKVVAHFKDMHDVDERLLGEYMLGIRKMDEAEMGDSL